MGPAHSDQAAIVANVKFKIGMEQKVTKQVVPDAALLASH